MPISLAYYGTVGIVFHSKHCSQGLREGGSGGASYPGLGGPGLKGPGKVVEGSVSVLSFGIAP